MAGRARLFRIVAMGNIANRLLQLVSARSLVARLGDFEISGPDIPEWNIHLPRAPHARRCRFELKGHIYDYGQVVRLVRRYGLRNITLRGLGFRCENYLPPETFRSLLRPSLPSTPAFGDNHLVINIRGNEILKGGVHADYGPLPIAFYKELIARERKTPVFMGQIADDYYSDLLRREFQSAQFIPSKGALADFDLIAQAKHVVISVSSFSWLAGWLSEAATIHMPVAGLFNPEQRPDVNLLPVADGRYRFYHFPRREWRGSEEDIAGLGGPVAVKILDRRGLEDVLETAARSLAARRRKKRLELEAYALADWLATRWSPE